jgi:hypothetical protein
MIDALEPEAQAKERAGIALELSFACASGLTFQVFYLPAGNIEFLQHPPFD